MEVGKFIWGFKFIQIVPLACFLDLRAIAWGYESDTGIPHFLERHLNCVAPETIRTNGMELVVMRKSKSS